MTAFEPHFKNLYYDLALQFIESSDNYLTVIDTDGKCQGIITEFDLATKSILIDNKSTYSSNNAIKAMVQSNHVVISNDDSPLLRSIDIALRNKLDYLPVIDIGYGNEGNLVDTIEILEILKRMTQKISGYTNLEKMPSATRNTLEQKELDFSMAISVKDAFSLPDFLDLEQRLSETICIKPETSVIQACQLMYSNRINVLLVVRGNKCIGTVTVRDIIKHIILKKLNPSITSVECVVSQEPFWRFCKSTDSLISVMKFMCLNNLTEVPIIPYHNSHHHHEDKFIAVVLTARCIIGGITSYFIRKQHDPIPIMKVPGGLNTMFRIMNSLLCFKSVLSLFRGSISPYATYGTILKDIFQCGDADLGDYVCEYHEKYVTSITAVSYKDVNKEKNAFDETGQIKEVGKTLSALFPSNESLGSLKSSYSPAASLSYSSDCSSSIIVEASDANKENISYVYELEMKNKFEMKSELEMKNICVINTNPPLVEDLFLDNDVSESELYLDSDDDRMMVLVDDESNLYPHIATKERHCLDKLKLHERKGDRLSSRQNYELAISAYSKGIEFAKNNFIETNESFDLDKDGVTIIQKTVQLLCKRAKVNASLGVALEALKLDIGEALYISSGCEDTYNRLDDIYVTCGQLQLQYHDWSGSYYSFLDIEDPVVLENQLDLLINDIQQLGDVMEDVGLCDNKSELSVNNNNNNNNTMDEIIKSVAWLSDCINVCLMISEGLSDKSIVTTATVNNGDIDCLLVRLYGSRRHYNTILGETGLASNDTENMKLLLQRKNKINDYTVNNDYSSNMNTTKATSNEALLHQGATLIANTEKLVQIKELGKTLSALFPSNESPGSLKSSYSPAASLSYSSDSNSTSSSIIVEASDANKENIPIF